MKNLILIEDDQFLQELYRELLINEFEVEIIGEGTQALSRLLSGGWDITLVDLTLPGLSGIKILEELHNEKKIKKGKIVVLTNSEDPALLSLAKKYSDGILIKSRIDPNEFVTKVKSFF